VINPDELIGRIIWADIARSDDQELDRERSLDPAGVPEP
jgi:hypothetical protein